MTISRIHYDKAMSLSGIFSTGYMTEVMHLSTHPVLIECMYAGDTPTNKTKAWILWNLHSGLKRGCVASDYFYALFFSVYL